MNIVTASSFSSFTSILSSLEQGDVDMGMALRSIKISLLHIKELSIANKKRS